MGAVGYLDAFALAGEYDRVFADDVAAAHGMDADLLMRPGTNHALAAVCSVRAEIAAQGFSDSLADHECGPAR